MTKETFTAYVTRYALSGGIKTVEVEHSESFPGMVTERNMHLSHYHGEDWHRTMEAAVVRAEKMRKAKIISLKKQIAKLEKLSF